MTNPQTGFHWLILAAGALVSGWLFAAARRRSGKTFLRAAAEYLAAILPALLLAKVFHAVLNLIATGEQGAEVWFSTAPRGFSFAAGCAGFCLGPALLSLRRRQEIPALLDDLAAPGCLLAAFARFGEIFSGQLGLADVWSLGLPDIRDGSLLARFPFAAADAWGCWYLSVSTLSAAAALAAAVYGFCAGGKGRFSAGVLFERCAVPLCAVRLFLELTRMESFIIKYVHVDQALCALFLLLLMIHACVRRKRTAGRFPVLPLVLTVACIALNGLVQFMMDKPWMFENVLPEGLFRWINDNLKAFGYSLLLLTAAVPAVLHALLCRGKKERE